jgi:hypothetical protein
MFTCCVNVNHLHLTMRECIKPYSPILKSGDIPKIRGCRARWCSIWAMHFGNVPHIMDFTEFQLPLLVMVNYSIFFLMFSYGFQ